MPNTEDDRIGAIEKVDGSNGVNKASKIQEEVEPAVRIPPDKEHFDQLMKQDIEKAPAFVSPAENDNGSLMDQIREINSKAEGVSQASPDTILAQASNVIKEIESVKAKLATPGLEIKDSVQNLMNNKLSHIDESLKVALNRAGIEYQPAPVAAATSLGGPIEKFIGLLTHGQQQLQRLSSDVAMLGNKNGNISPADMLAIQIKVGYVQQEVELFTNVLNKSLESIKTIMNVQI